MKRFLTPIVPVVCMRIVHAYLDAITNFGAMPFIVTVMVVTWFTSQYSLFWNVLYSFVATFVLIALIKLIFFKHRPENKSAKAKPRGIIDRVDMSTFPSFHSANASYLAIFLSINFQNLALTVFFAFLAVCVIISRVVLKKHYVADVSVGTALGVLASAAVIYLL